MATALVCVSTGVMKPLLAKLSKLLEEEYVKLKGVRKQIKFLRDELSIMNTTFQMLADQEELSPQTRDWRDKVRELAYDMEDCIDAFMVHVDDKQHDGHTVFKGLLHKLKILMASHKIANTIEQLKTRAIESSERHRRYNFVDPALNSSSSRIDPRLPWLYEEVDKLVGIDGPKEHVVKWFAKEKRNENIKVLSIVGSGGLGKTTLANQVYCQLKGQFQSTAFVSMSRNPYVKKILRQIHTEVGITGTPPDDERQLIDRIRDYLKDKRYCVVIDDLWDTEVWKAIRPALFNNRRGSRIIMTTRNFTVASCCSSDGGYVYEMEALSFEDTRRLFCKRAFGSEDLSYPHLEELCNGILEKCGGLPLAVITMSSLLADQLAIDEWNRVLNATGRTLAKDPNSGHMTTILSFSYFDLPHHLRSCLLYLSLFPEDYIINKQHLISRWIAEGFIHEEEGRSKYEVGERYFTDLINKSLIQPYAVEYGQVLACRVHDIILDFITCKAAEENFVTLSGASELERCSDFKVRRLCIGSYNKDNVTVSSSLIPSYVRSLTIFGHALGISLLAFTNLRVLDLEDCGGLQDHHLLNIEKLFHLKYLRLNSSSITVLPRKIGDLRYLETLDIRGTKVKEFPSTIINLQRLARLYVNKKFRFPFGMIGKMQSLEELEDFSVHSYEVRQSVQELGQLTKLRTLKVRWAFFWSCVSEGRAQADELQSYLGTLICSRNLRHLYIHEDASLGFLLSLESWCPSMNCRLRKLYISYCQIYKVPNWMGALGNLEELELYLYSMSPDDVEILGAIHSLLFLELGTLCGTNGRITIPGNKKFRSLKYFSMYIIYCGTTLEFETGSMPKLEHLKLRFPVHKECVNGVSDYGLQHLSTLAKVEVAIGGNFHNNSEYNPASDENDCIGKYVAGLIKFAIDTLPNPPKLRFATYYYECRDFEEYVEFINQMYGEY